MGKTIEFHIQKITGEAKQQEQVALLFHRTEEHMLNNKGFDLLDFVKNKEIFQYKDGYLEIPTKPGLGIEIDEEMVEKVSLEGLNWRNPSWKNYDGTIAEW